VRNVHLISSILVFSFGSFAVTIISPPLFRGRQ